VTELPVSTGGDGNAPPSPPVVEFSSITKRFGSVVACDRVDLTLHSGRIHGVLGENGAGKSTLMKILIGLVLPDEGTISINGKRCQILDPADAAKYGIGMVHQHFSLVEPLTVWENVALGDAGKLDPAAVRRRVGEISDHYGLAIEPDARVGELTAGLRQRVEIIKCLRRDPSIVVFDEPTSVLTPDESEQLFESLRNVVQVEGRTVVLVSHKLDEVLNAADDITIMRQGKVVDRLLTADADVKSLARSMVGREVALRSERGALGIMNLDAHGPLVDNPNGSNGARSPGAVQTPRVDSDPGGPTASPAPQTRGPGVGGSPGPGQARIGALVLRDVTAVGPGGARLLDGLSLEVVPGEIVGVAGVEGNGQRALADLMSSLVPLSSGSVTVSGTEVSSKRSGAMSRARVAVIAEDRHDSGVVLEMSVAENLVLIDQSRVATRGVINRRKATELAVQMIDEFDIQCSGPDAPMWSLSGGNQQRVVLARELFGSPAVLVAAQPTRGLDVGAIEYMTDRIRQAAADGVAVLLISSELEEILDVADRIVVMYRGKIVGEMPGADADLERIGLLMGGAVA